MPELADLDLSQSPGPHEDRLFGDLCIACQEPLNDPPIAIWGGDIDKAKRWCLAQLASHKDGVPKNAVASLNISERLHVVASRLRLLSAGFASEDVHAFVARGEDYAEPIAKKLHAGKGPIERMTRLDFAVIFLGGDFDWARLVGIPRWQGFNGLRRRWHVAAACRATARELDCIPMGLSMCPEKLARLLGDDPGEKVAHLLRADGPIAKFALRLQEDPERVFAELEQQEREAASKAKRPHRAKDQHETFAEELEEVRALDDPFRSPRAELLKNTYGRRDEVKTFMQLVNVVLKRRGLRAESEHRSTHPAARGRKFFYRAISA